MDEFLNALGDKVEENKRVYEPLTPQMVVLLDELKGLTETKEGEDSPISRSNVSKVVPLDAQKFFVQVAHIRLEEGVQVFMANVDLIAHKDKEGFLFSPPLARSTKDWEAPQLGNRSSH